MLTMAGQPGSFQAIFLPSLVKDENGNDRDCRAANIKYEPRHLNYLHMQSSENDLNIEQNTKKYNPL